MSWYRYIALFAITANASAGEGYVVGGGLQVDSADGLAGTLLGSYGFSEQTWVSAGLAMSTVDVELGPAPETVFADLEVDHWFKPVGVRLGAAYWGDPDVFESQDWRASLYWKGDEMLLSGNYEFRDFSLYVPETELTTARTVTFDANGFGLSARFGISKNVDLSLSGMQYDYSVDFTTLRNRDSVRFLGFSRLGLINSIIDNRARVSLGLNHGLQRWQLDLATWTGAIDGSRTKSVALSFLTAMSTYSDIEISLGYDQSELYGDVTFASLFFYFYGGN
jgi:hypothetical protein